MINKINNIGGGGGNIPTTTNKTPTLTKVSRVAYAPFKALNSFFSMLKSKASALLKFFFSEKKVEIFPKEIPHDHKILVGENYQLKLSKNASDSEDEKNLKQLLEDGNFEGFCQECKELASINDKMQGMVEDVIADTIAVIGKKDTSESFKQMKNKLKDLEKDVKKNIFQKETITQDRSSIIEQLGELNPKLEEKEKQLASLRATMFPPRTSKEKSQKAKAKKSIVNKERNNLKEKIEQLEDELDRLMRVKETTTHKLFRKKIPTKGEALTAGHKAHWLQQLLLQ